ncbi:hypothetical protein HYPSUDRAFT_1099250 [Hypholoma sublateritium FD-334 SS-4]|uniref:Phospholipid scramblase n=1 Tax=Hypholoma sublateritium (strain FD-334 SS-4) TaxID=945553 RepID=A0A0D2NHX4_HYPSF|nr:hypothetical protein HYPSUDRAFT_1099250 [Hypholoma sublateritium FD-334 SS-4]
MFAALWCKRLPPALVHDTSQHQIRTYAISRFPKRVVGSGRERPQVKSPNLTENDVSDDTPPALQRSTFTAEPLYRPDDSGLSKLLMYRDTLIIERQLEMLNVFIGFEQSNKYTINGADGEPLGYVAEEPRGFWGTLSRQAFSTHRPFRAVIMDKEGVPVRRPFSWINSRMFVQRLKDHSDSPHEADPVHETFGEVQQIWHLWRRRYDLFLREHLPTKLDVSDVEQQNEQQHRQYYQIAKVDSGFLAWDFCALNERGVEIARVERAFRGIGREATALYNVTLGRYSIHFKTPGVQSSLPDISSTLPPNISQNTSTELNIDARSVSNIAIADTVNIDFDYFSRHSHTGGCGFSLNSSCVKNSDHCKYPFFQWRFVPSDKLGMNLDILRFAVHTIIDMWLIFSPLFN